MTVKQEFTNMYNYLEISTSAWSDEVLIIATDLSVKDVVKTLAPVVAKERENFDVLSNSEYVKELRDAHQNAFIEVVRLQYIEL